MNKNSNPRFNFHYLSWIFLFSLIVINSPVHAQKKLTGIYSGFIFSNSTDEFKSDQMGTFSESRGHLKAKLGKALNEVISVEGQLGMTSNSDTDRGVFTYGGYVRIHRDFSQYKLYGLLGYGGISAYDKASEDVNESGLSYGVGIEIFGSKDLALTFEYISLLDKSANSNNPDFGSGDLSFDTLGIGFTYYFSNESSYFNKNRKKINAIRY